MLGTETISPARPSLHVFCTSGVLLTSLKPTVLFRLNVISPLAPFLVVMTTTPLAARTPYKAVAAGPFNIETLSISLGLRSALRFVNENCSDDEGAFEPVLGKTLPVGLSLLIGIPSTTNNG